MAEVAFTIAGRSYNLACEDGEEVRLAEVASLVDEEATKLMQGAGQISEARLMLMTSLMLADRMDDAIKALDAKPTADPAAEAATAATIDTASDRLEALNNTPTTTAAAEPAPAVTAEPDPAPEPDAEPEPAPEPEPSTQEQSDQDDTPPEPPQQTTAEVEDLHQIIARRRARLNRAIEADKQAKEAGDETD